MLKTIRSIGAGLNICLFFVLTTIDLHAQLAEDKCRFLGNIIGGYTPSDFATYWNQVTPENAGKWGSVEGTMDVMQWGSLDNAYNFAKANGFPFKQHAFVWGQQQPAWITTLTPQEQNEQVVAWIQTYCERYPDTQMIDVVNEPLHAPPSYASSIGGGGTTGWDWVIWSFEKARAHCPNAKLILNDYNIINNNSATDSYLAIINLLKTRGLIDGIGEQGHFLETTPVETLTSNLNKLHATGLPIYISEYDVNIADPAAQREKYMEQFPVLWTHPGVQGITFWGYRQGEIWRENAYLIESNGTERPALTWLKGYVPVASGGKFCSPVTGMKENESGLRIYPNPATNGNFTLESNAGKLHVNILDLQGRAIQTIHVPQQEPVYVQLQVAPGIYLLEIFNGRKTTFKKIVVN